ncbi:MAG: TetR/AcrR family transcriptional regulator [Mycobacterium sp.]|nr:MAG: TetR/AcrR family transcriptional regulator [Mycobacterium sp.]
MAPPRKHETDLILDATRALVLTAGPRAASVAAIAKASGAPAGTLYHRFGNRDGVVMAAWLRALDRFQQRALAATGDTAVDHAVAMAVSAIAFAREFPDDARLLLTIRPADLVDSHSDTKFRETLAAMNAPLTQRMHELTHRLYGSGEPRAQDAVYRAVSDLPYAVVRRHAQDDPMPDWLEADVAAAARAVLHSYGEKGDEADGIT